MFARCLTGGWRAVDGVKGDKKTVLDYVEKTWTDMRPLSLRRWMDEQSAAMQAGHSMASHDERYFHLADRLIRMENGQITAIETSVGGDLAKLAPAELVAAQ